MIALSFLMAYNELAPELDDLTDVIMDSQIVSKRDSKHIEFFRLLGFPRELVYSGVVPSGGAWHRKLFQSTWIDSSCRSVVRRPLIDM